MKSFIFSLSAFATESKYGSVSKPFRSPNRSQCYYAGGVSGAYVECWPDFYIAGLCESGSTAGDNGGHAHECHGGGIQGYDFQLTCCLSDPFHNFIDRTMCEWRVEECGVEVDCSINADGIETPGRAAYGRCGTQTNDAQNQKGDCEDTSLYPVPDAPECHAVMCCDTTQLIDDDKCGWIYARHGATIDCPGYTVAAGFCGSGPFDVCQKTKSFGVRCCPME